jgi:predicted dehydrogenase
MRAQGVPLVSDDPDAVFGHRDVDAVLVLTSMNAHGLLTERALCAGKHVLVEKPMATDFAHAQSLVALARASRLTLMPAPHVTLSPTFKRLRAQLRDGAIGQVLAARAIYGWIGPSWGRWFYEKGGGPIFDLGVYNITTLVGLLGPVRRVLAMTAQAMPDRIVEDAPMRIETEDNAHILLDFGAGVLASVFTGFTIHDKQAPAIEIYGSAGVMNMIGDDWHPDGLTRFDPHTRAWSHEAESAPDWPWTDGLRHLVDCLRDGVAPEITPELGLHVLEIMLKAMDSGREGRAFILETAPLLQTAART